MYFSKIILHALKVIEVMLDLVTCNKYQLLEQIFLWRNSTFCQFCCMIFRESMSNPAEFFFKVQSLKLFWSDIALHQSIIYIYIASESLNDALTEVNFFNKSDTKKKLWRRRCENLKNTVCE